MKINEFFDTMTDFLLHMRTTKNLSDHTCRAYGSDLNQLYTFWQASAADMELKDALNKFRNHLTKQKASTSTLARKLSCFNSYEHYLNDKGIVLNLGLVRPHVPTPIPQALSIQEISLLLDQIPIERLTTNFPHRDKAILELLYATGIRCSELINIRLCDIDMAAQSIIIPNKRKQTRIVFFGNQAKEQLELYLQHERKAAENNQEYVLLNYRNQPLTSRSIQRICNMFGALLESKKIITPHLLRHSFATHLLEQGAEPKTVQQLLGFTTTLSIEKYL